MARAPSYFATMVQKTDVSLAACVVGASLTETALLIDISQRTMRI